MKKKDSPLGFVEYLKNKDNLIRQGAELLKAKKYDKLIGICDKLIRQNDSNAEAWMFKGAALRRKRQFEEAVVCLDKSLKNSLMNWRALKEMGYLQLDRKNIPLAIHAFEGTMQWQLTVLGTIQPNILYNLGSCYEMIGKFEKAIEYYDKFLMAEPMDIKAWINKAMSQKLCGKFDAALQSFKRILQINPTSEVALEQSKLLTKDLEHKDLAIIKNQIFLKRGGGRAVQFPKDLETAEKIDLPPDKMKEYKKAKTNIIMNQGVSFHEFGGNMIGARKEFASLDKAIEQSDIILKLVPYDLDVIFEKGEALLESKKYREAVKHFDDSLKLGSKLGRFMQISGTYYKSIAQKELDKDLGFLWLYKAEALEKLGQYDEALISYKKAKEYSDKLLPKVKAKETIKKPVKTQSPQKPMNFCQSCERGLSKKVQERIRSKGRGFCPYCGKPIGA